jgi:hypothetical protein
MSIAKIKGGGGGDNAKRGCDDAGNCDGDSDGNPIVTPAPAPIQTQQSPLGRPLGGSVCLLLDG